MKNPHKTRLQKVMRTLSEGKETRALLVSSAPQHIRSRDTHFEYRQNSDFYYLTGSRARECLLMLSSKQKTPLLFVPKADPVKILWEGKPPNFEELAQHLGAKLVEYSDAAGELLQHLRDVDVLYYQNEPHGMSWEITSKLLAIRSHERGALPARFHHSDLILENLRLFKDPEEVRLIRQANAITNGALMEAAPMMRPGNSESEIASTIDYIFRICGAEVAFASIVAAGPSAATLHYEAKSRKLRKGDMLLIDCGAEHEMYAGDITRVVPVGGKFDPIHRQIYSIVLAAQKAALSKVKHGVKIATVYDAAARVLTQGLVDLKVLKGSVPSLMEKKAFRPYFPHGIGHSLGLDVHDVGKLRGNNEARLLTGMVFTVEPGLYFSRKIGKVPACGVRIEDNVLVTKNGCEILSAGFPKELDEIEQLMENAELIGDA